MQKSKIKYQVESCHDKRLADSIGATVKNAINNIVPLHPHKCIYNVFDLLLQGLEKISHLFSYKHSSSSIDKVNKLIPRSDRIVGTIKLHEMLHEIQVQYPK